MAPLEPWEKVLVSLDYVTTPHGGASCEDCHAGVQAADKEAAHTGLIPDPSAEGGTACTACHGPLVETFAGSLHATQAGYWTAIEARSIPENHPQLEEMFGNHCASCHTTCGDCHIAQPDSVGGGLLSGHEFEKTPPMTRTCTACHGSRVGAEYMGKHEGILADVHFRQARFNCISCHTADNLHASPDETASQRYAGEQMPKCETCHIDLTSLPQHTLHQDVLACQVCHSMQYTSCDGCHVAVSETTGSPFFKTEATYLGLYIGLNPLQDTDRPYKYVLLRHVPVSPDSYAYYGDDLLPNFNNMPTWTYTTPHNIQRLTPQNQACESCHGSPDLFLTADKVDPAELEANQNVIVPNPPEAMGNK